MLKKITFFTFLAFGCFKIAAAEPLALEPVPWPDGERLEMKIISPQDGNPLGHLVFSAYSVDVNTGSIWRIESDRFFSRDNTSEFTRVDAAKDSFVPFDAFTKNKDGDFNTVYDKDSLTLTVKRDNKSCSSKTRYSDTVYDNEQILHLVRRLPLTAGYKTSFKVFSATDNAIAKCKLEVSKEIENTTWVKGRMPCFVVDIRAYVFFIKVEEHRLWISTDSRRLPLKHTTADNILELTNFYTAPPKNKSANAL